VFAVLRKVGKGIGYVYDGTKALAGVNVYAAGVIVDAFGEVIAILADATKKLDEMARELPAFLRPEWVGKAAAVVDKWAVKVGDIGTKMQKWGKDALFGFGQSSAVVDTFFDKVQAKFKGTDRLAKNFGQVLSGAFVRGGADAYSIMAKFNAANMLSGQNPEKDPVVVAKKQLDQLKEIKKGQWRIVGFLDRGTVVKVADE
jgi:hypothetical protein